MPSLGADMTEGTLLEWLVKPGDTVHKGDVVAVVDTSKSAIDVECFDSGVVTDLLVHEGSTVAVGTPLAVIGAADTAPPPPEPQHVPVSPIVRKLAHETGVDIASVRGTGRRGAVTKKDIEHAASARRATPAASRRRVTPHARRLAEDLGVDLDSVAGDGVINAADVRAAAEPQPDRRAVSPAGMRETIAAAMSRSKREIPHYYLATTIDMGPCLDWLHEHNRAVPVEERLVPAVLLLKATALAATKIPEINGHWTDGGFVPAPSVDLGVAVSLRGGGLLVPVLTDAAHTDVPTLMRRLRDAVSHARTGRLRSSELAPASLTVTNLGDLGVEVVHGVIHPPQVALVGFGAVMHRPWAVDGLLGIRPVITASLAADHRVTDGAVGARFLSIVGQLLNHPHDL